MQVVAASIADAAMDALQAGFRLVPVVAVLDLAAHRLLRLAQGRFVPLEAVEWRVERAIRERGETGYAHVDANGSAVKNGLLDLALGLNRHGPLAAGLTYGDVLHRTPYVPAVAVANPAELGQKQAAVALIEFVNRVRLCYLKIRYSFCSASGRRS